MGNNPSTNIEEISPKSENKSSKQKRDAAKRKMSKLKENEEQKKEKREEELCKLNMVNDNQGLPITPLQTQYLTPPPPEPPDKGQQICKTNTVPLIDEYEVENSEDGCDKDNQPLHDQEYDDEPTQALIRAFTPPYGENPHYEVQQVTQTQGLYRRRF